MGAVLSVFSIFAVAPASAASQTGTGWVAAWLAAAKAAAAKSAAPKSAPVHAAVNPSNGLLKLTGTFNYSYPFMNGAFVTLAQGTTAYSANITVNGVSRRYLVVRPDPAPLLAPLLILLHPLGTTPEDMADLTEVSNFVATQGFWAVLPAGKKGQWDDNPVANGSDDVQFISQVIDTLIAQGVNGQRVYAAGYSDGGFMAERLACELSDKIAAFGVDAATLITGQDSYCKPAVQRPKLYILGASDPLVPYGGGLFFMNSAEQTMSFWKQQQGCGGTVAETLPKVVNDGTTVQLTDYTGCTAGQALRLYTIENGGHAWPGGLTQMVGKTSQNLNATGIIWAFASGYTR
ncbi:MAG: PHB depolymerase family esterase [Nevskia sp.]|nr:PHB depolymerase family esterase [Nevskia sp.]